MFAHSLESRRDRLLYPQRVLLEKKGGAIAPFAPPGYATDFIYKKGGASQDGESDFLVSVLVWASSCSLLFHGVTSLHPPSFQRNDFSTCISIHRYDYVIGRKKQESHDQLEEFLERMLEVLKYR